MNDSPILYFFEDGNIPEELNWRFKECEKVKPASGPEGMTGGMLVAPFPGVRVPGKQDHYRGWNKMGDCWINVRENIAPEELARPDGVPGYMVELGDGNQWRIPVALLDAPHFSMPRYETVDEEGKWTWKVAEKFEFITALAQEIWESITDKGSIPMADEVRIRNACTAVIAVNYNLTAYECAAMQLLTREAYASILRAVVDAPGFEEVCAFYQEGKKKVSEGTGMTSGNADS